MHTQILTLIRWSPRKAILQDACLNYSWASAIFISNPSLHTVFGRRQYFLDTMHDSYLFCLADAFGFVNYGAIRK